MDRRTFVTGTAASAAFLPGAARAQDAYPTRPVTILNAFPPGGINDVVTRPAASALEAIFKQPVVVETKAGAAGGVGAQVAANARAIVVEYRRDALNVRRGGIAGDQAADQARGDERAHVGMLEQTIEETVHVLDGALSRR